MDAGDYIESIPGEENLSWCLGRVAIYSTRLGAGRGLGLFEMLQKSRSGRFAMLISVSAIVAGSCGSAPETPAPRPNIILVSLDTLRPDHLEVYGYGRETAPALARLAEQAVVFDNAFSQAPKTAPSHMSIFTGLYPSSHGVRNLDDESENRALSPGIPLMAEVLRDVGYRTAGFTGGGHMGSALGFDRGFETFEPGGSQFRRAADWVRGLPVEEHPFFLLVHTYSIHDPYLSRNRFQIFSDPEYEGDIIGNRQKLIRVSGKGWNNQHKAFWARVDPEDPADLRHLKDLYDAGILSTDFQLSQFLGTLQELGLFEDSLLIVLSDHGEEFQEHGGFLHINLYQENLRVPFLVRFPGALGASLAGARMASTIRLIDLLPTLLDFLELEGAHRLQGSSFLSLLTSPDRRVSREVMSEWPGAGHRAIQMDAWKLIINPDGEEELYNTAADPAEVENLVAAKPLEADRLRAELSRLVGESEGIHQVVGSGEPMEVDPEVRKQLEALGYIE